MIEYLTIDQVIELHDEMLKRYGGLPGIRDTRRSTFFCLTFPDIPVDLL
jgi:prophage maintenance system killer protein